MAMNVTVCREVTSEIVMDDIRMVTAGLPLPISHSFHRPRRELSWSTADGMLWNDISMNFSVMKFDVFVSVLRDMKAEY